MNVAEGLRHRVTEHEVLMLEFPEQIEQLRPEREELLEALREAEAAAADRRPSAAELWPSAAK
jgi:hypothetical protein